MESNFDSALRHTLKHEGGKVDHPKDPGGRTNQGVTQRVYSAYRSRRGLSPRDVYLMSDAERDEIYRKQYWDPCRCDALPVGLDYAVFDGAVNSGPVQSAKWLQRALGSYYRGSIDGMIGQGTLAAVSSHPNKAALLAGMLDRRMAFLRALKTWGTFGRGWTNRINGVRKVATEMLSARPIPVPRSSPAPAPASVSAPSPGAPNAKARIEDATPRPSASTGDLVASAGVVQVILAQAAEQLTPLAGQSPAIDAILTALTVLGTLMGVGGAALRTWARRQEAERADALDLPPSGF